MVFSKDCISKICKGKSFNLSTWGPAAEPRGICDEACIPGRVTAGIAPLWPRWVLGHDWFSGGWQRAEPHVPLSSSLVTVSPPQPHASSDLAPQGLAAVSLVCSSRSPYGRESMGLQGHLLGPLVTTLVPHSGPSAQSGGAPVQSWPRAPKCWVLSLPARPAGGPG